MLKDNIKDLEELFLTVTNGFKVIENKAKADFDLHDKGYIKELAYEAYRSEMYQVRMYGVFLFGYLSQDDDILDFMKKEVSKDDNWRVQEILAKSFDNYCSEKGYKNSLATIDVWLSNENPNTRRAVTEGLRVWTSRDYFNKNPKEAIRRLSHMKQDSSQYVRKSVGNSLRDISKKFPELIEDELKNWKLDTKETRQVYKLASRFIEKKKSED